jgi:hypothetical protein
MRDIGGKFDVISAQLNIRLRTLRSRDSEFGKTIETTSSELNSANTSDEFRGDRLREKLTRQTAEVAAAGAHVDDAHAAWEEKLNGRKRACDELRARIRALIVQHMRQRRAATDDDDNDNGGDEIDGGGVAGLMRAVEAAAFAVEEAKAAKEASDKERAHPFPFTDGARGGGGGSGGGGGGGGGGSGSEASALASKSPRRCPPPSMLDVVHEFL